MPEWKDCFKIDTKERRLYINFSDGCEFPLNDRNACTIIVAEVNGDWVEYSQEWFDELFLLEKPAKKGNKLDQIIKKQLEMDKKLDKVLTVTMISQPYVTAVGGETYETSVGEKINCYGQKESEEE